MKKGLLQNCKACGTELSRYSLFCRRCGHPRGSMLAIWALGLFLLLLVAYYIAFCIYGITLAK